MAFTLLESRAEIRQAQQSLEKTLEKAFPRAKGTRNISHPGPHGGIDDCRIFVESRLKQWFWSKDYKDSPSPRRLNWFGKLTDSGPLDITVEINTAYEGCNRRLAGFFARDLVTGCVFLFHSGRVGGGHPGVGKFTFLTWSNLQLVEVTTSDQEILTGILVMQVSGRDAPRSLTSFVETVARFKNAVRSGEITAGTSQKDSIDLKDYYSESVGKRKRRRTSELEYMSRHGEVVDALDRWRKQKGVSGGLLPIKSVYIDYGIGTRAVVSELYEVKTSTSRSDIYCAIGQLMTHGSNQECVRHIVLPDSEELSKDLDSALNRLDIKLIRFKMTKKGVRILS